MKTPKNSLRKIVTFLNNSDEDGGFWLPNIQRPFVWSEEQIYRLFDSILREYPISTLLIWKTRSSVRCRKFIDNYKVGLRLSDFYVPENDKKKCLVLDGQQRLQGLFIGLCGSYEGRELYFDILSGEVSAPDDIKYKFSFLDSKKAAFPWIKFKELVFDKSCNLLSTAKNLIMAAGKNLTPKEETKITENVGIIFKNFHSDDGISYQELDSIDNIDLYKEDDVVEIFIRANSGGTTLSKSDLLFSLLTSSWDDANDNMEIILDELNARQFDFKRDFILKTCLTLLDQGASYEVSKFRKNDIREKIKSEWERIVSTIKDVADFVQGSTFIRCDEALPSYLVLIPLIYLRYHFFDSWKEKKNVELYLIRSLLTGVFGGRPDQLIDNIVSKLKERKVFDVDEVFGVIRSEGRSLELTEDKFWTMGYGSKNIHLLFNLWYRTFNYTPAYAGNLPQVDHIFPQSLLRRVRISNPHKGLNNIIRYGKVDRNQLANCMLLSATENGAGGKGDTPPEEWFKDKNPEYLKLHMVPNDPDLWKLERFEDFIEERKKLIKASLGYLLSSYSTSPSVT